MCALMTTDVSALAETINQFGAPTVMCVLLIGVVKYIYDNNLKQMNDIQEKHTEEANKMVEALNNNTLVIQKLVDKIGGEI